MEKNESLNRKIEKIKLDILSRSSDSFNLIADQIFKLQYEHNKVFNSFCKAIGVRPLSPFNNHEFPLLPISAFKHRLVKTSQKDAIRIFKSSSTSGIGESIHHCVDIDWYEKVSKAGFEQFYDRCSDYVFLALLPNYLEKGDSSLVHMVDHFMAQSSDRSKNFYLHDHQALIDHVRALEKSRTKYVLIGVSYALLDFLDKFSWECKYGIVMETGGMKGRKVELPRTELHRIMKSKIFVSQIHSEYGMTELTSQAYSKGEGIFKFPSTILPLIKDVSDPLSNVEEGRAGLLGFIDLGNIHSCSFILSEDLAQQISEDEYLILGRADHSEARGCNLMVANY